MSLWRGLVFWTGTTGLLSADLAAQIGDFTESSLRRRLVAEAFAPVIYQHETLDLLDLGTGFNPIDSILSFNFDGNSDLRDNARNAFLLTDERARNAAENPEVYFSVIESRSHFYVNYIVYHAIDTNGIGHAHDTENKLLIVRKTKKFPGELEVLITNAHGFPMIYSPNPDVEAGWRDRTKSRYAQSLLLKVDVAAQSHHSADGLEVIEHKSGRAPVIFSHSRSHALYKFNSKAWSEMGQVGSLYIPKSCLECSLAPLMFSGIRKTIHYQLKDFDEMMLGVRAVDDWSLVFQDWKSKQVLSRGKYRERELPGYLAAGVLDARPAAILFFRGSFKTAYPLSDPVALHRYFQPDDQSVSTQYLLNAYLEMDSP